MTSNVRMAGIVLEAADPIRLGEFYRDLTTMKISESDDEWVTLEGEGGSALSIQRAAGHQPPTWPDPASSMQSHIDFEVDDLDAAEALAVRLGAMKFDHQPGTSFRVFADPAGHPFCLCAA